MPLANHCRPAPAWPTRPPRRPNPFEKSRLLPASLCPWGLLVSPQPCTSAAAQPAFLGLAASASVSAASRFLSFPRVLAQLQVLGCCQSATPFLAFTSASHSLYVGHVFCLLSRFWKPSWSSVCQKTVFYSPILCISKKNTIFPTFVHPLLISPNLGDLLFLINGSHPSSTQDHDNLTVENIHF